MNEISIVPYNKVYAQSFYDLNNDWISMFWTLEDSDLKDLLNPESSIISKGGEIFFAISDTEVVGTSAMILWENNIFEMAKMTVAKNFRGRGISKLLLNRCIDFARTKSSSGIFLISNDNLTIARSLYDQFGFKEVSLDSQKYHRGNVKMTLDL
jgi:N-acetylglutamate synthase-like GNAT family acetyltransferase